MKNKIISVFLLLFLGFSLSFVYAEETTVLEGDINGNGVINSIDFKMLWEYLQSNQDKLYDQRIDMNGDGIINTVDLEILKHHVSTLELHGFYPKESFKANNFNQKHMLKYFNDLSFAFYDVLYNSSLDEKHSVSISSMIFNANHMEAIQAAKQNNIPIRFNLYAKMSELKNILPFEEKRHHLIQLTIDMLSQEIVKDTETYWDGVVIDFEELRNTRMNPNDGTRENVLYEGKLMSEWYIQFLQELRQALDLSEKGLDVYAAVPFSNYYDAYNYREIANIVDRIIVMAHDYEPKQNIPKSDVMLYLNNPSYVDSLAPITKIDKVIKTLTNEETGIQDPKKVILQISFGTAQWKFPNVEKAEDWAMISSETEGKYSTPSYEQIYQRMVSQIDTGVPNYIKELESPYIVYHNSMDKSYNFILYEDSRSVAEKIKKTQEAGFSGLSLWSLGRIPSYENPIRDSISLELHFDVWSQVLESMGIKHIN